jgi:hypothetical protein
MTRQVKPEYQVSKVGSVDNRLSVILKKSKNQLIKDIIFASEKQVRKNFLLCSSDANI